MPTRMVEHAAECDACRELLACVGRVRAAERARAVTEPSDEADTRSWVAAPRRAEPEAGARVLGRYQLVREVGRGGMGVVYEAHDPELGRRVAVKVLHHCRDATKLARIAREAQAVAALSHPNVVEIFDVSLGDEQAFIVMEFVEGITLREWLLDVHPDPPAVLEAFTQAGRGLAAAHAAGLVHRDFKPSNAIIDVHGRVKVLDFGLARPDLESSGPHSLDTPVPFAAATLTATGTAMGTPSYMAPEQHRGERVDARADVYGFGVALYEALYGELPFVARSLEHLLVGKRHGVPADPPDARVSRSIHAAIAKALAYDPARRFASMTALLEALHARPVRRRHAGFVGAAILVGLATLAVVSEPVTDRDAAPRSVAAIDVQLEAEAERLLALAEAQGERADGAQGLGTAAAALTLAAASGSPTLLARAEIQFGGSLVDAERFDLATVRLREGIAHLRVLGEDRLAARGSIRLIYALGELDRPNEALAVGREARSLAERVDDDGTLLVGILENEASASSPGPDAIARQERALALRRANPSLGTPRSLAMTLSNLGSYVDEIDPERARDLFAEALEIRERTLGVNHRDTVNTSLNLAGLDGEIGDYTRCHERAIDAYARFGPAHTRHRAAAAALASLCLEVEGELDRSLVWIDRALGDHPGRANENALYTDALEAKAALLHARGELAEGEALLLRTLTLREARARGPDRAVATSFHNLAFLVHARGDLQRAESYARRAVEGFAATGDGGRSMLQSRLELGRILVELERSDEVLDLLADHLDLPAEGTPVDPMIVAEIKATYARALWASGRDRPRALELAREAMDSMQRRDDYIPEREHLALWLASRSTRE